MPAVISDGTNVKVNSTGNPYMAVGSIGDVPAGMGGDTATTTLTMRHALLPLFAAPQHGVRGQGIGLMVRTHCEA